MLGTYKIAANFHKWDPSPLAQSGAGSPTFRTIIDQVFKDRIAELVQNLRVADFLCPLPGLSIRFSKMSILLPLCDIFLPLMRVLQVGLMPKLFRTIILASLILGAMIWASPDLLAQDSGSVALSGVVSSPQEGLMEGVVVNARRDSANFTVPVGSE